MWGIPTFMVVRAYLKMNPDDQKSAINDFKSRDFILTIGFLGMGAFVRHLGVLLTVQFMEIIGVAFFALGGLFSATDLWKKSKWKSGIILVIVATLTFVGVC